MGKPNILIIDNNADQLNEAVALLEAKGMKVSGATDAKGALEILRISLPKMVLVDTALYGIDGLTIARILKNDPDTQKIIVIALTQSDDAGMLVKIKEASCDGHILKPIQASTFASRVKSFMPGFW